MLSVCGCQLTIEDTAALVGHLEDDPTVVSDEASAAITFAVEAGFPVDRLDRDLRDAVRRVLQDPLSPGLDALRAALDGGCC